MKIVCPFLPYFDGGQYIVDAITGKRVNSEEQLVRVSMERRRDKEVTADEISRLPKTSPIGQKYGKRIGRLFGTFGSIIGLLLFIICSKWLIKAWR